MEIVLRSDIDKLGKRGDLVSVADGYARNFLIPRGHAIVATVGIQAQAKAMRSKRDRAEAKNREVAQQEASKLTGVVLKIEARAGSEGKLFGSVTNHEIADALENQAGIVVDRRQVEIKQPIRTLGDHSAVVKLHADVHVAAAVEVVALDE